jgi:hypothetical protein
MITNFIPFGVEELENLKKYALASLNDEERLFVQTAEQKLQDLIDDKSDKFLQYDCTSGLYDLWQKYYYLKPFCFAFSPQKIMPEVFHNEQAFIIWTAWRSGHLLDKQSLKKASLAAASVLGVPQAPYSPKVKGKAIRRFSGIMHLELSLSELSFWEKHIFPFLEGVWEFKWERKNS